MKSNFLQFQIRKFQAKSSSWTWQRTINLFKKLKLPNIDRIFIEHCDYESKDLLEFLKYSFPDEVNIFTFGYYMSEPYKSISYYLSGLERALKSVRNIVLINGWVHSKESIERIVKASWNWRELDFRWSDFWVFDNFDFTGPKYKIQKISIHHWGYNPYHWVFPCETLYIFIKAISETNIKDTLTILDICGCNIDNSTAKAYLNEFGMSNVNVENTEIQKDTGYPEHY